MAQFCEFNCIIFSGLLVQTKKKVTREKKLICLGRTRNEVGVTVVTGRYIGKSDEMLGSRGVIGTKYSLIALDRT